MFGFSTHCTTQSRRAVASSFGSPVFGPILKATRLRSGANVAASSGTGGGSPGLVPFSRTPLWTWQARQPRSLNTRRPSARRPLSGAGIDSGLTGSPCSSTICGT